MRDLQPVVGIYSYTVDAIVGRRGSGAHPEVDDEPVAVPGVAVAEQAEDDGSRVRQRVVFHLGRYRSTKAYLRAWTERAQRHHLEAARLESLTESLAADYVRQFGRHPSTMTSAGPLRVRTSSGVEVVGAEAWDWSW